MDRLHVQVVPRPVFCFILAAGVKDQLHADLEKMRESELKR